MSVLSIRCTYQMRCQTDHISIDLSRTIIVASVILGIDFFPVTTIATRYVLRVSSILLRWHIVHQRLCELFSLKLSLGVCMVRALFPPSFFSILHVFL